MVYHEYEWPCEVVILPKKFDEASRCLVRLSQLGGERVSIPLEDIRML
jgi:hypothetical protein